MNRFHALMTVLLLVCPFTLSAQEITFQGLVREMTDLNRLTRMPAPAYTTRQFSSYDRKSTNPAVSTEANWFANGDRGQVIREEKGAQGTEYVLMDTDGPGAIIRFWSANPNEGGIVRIYLDQAEKPVFEMPLEAMLGGKEAPFAPPIAAEASRGFTSYFPIPYAKHCKVTTSKRDIYYQINYRTYAAGTPVTTLTREIIAGQVDTPAQAATILAAPDRWNGDSGDATEDGYEVVLTPSEEQALTLTGPAAIREITCEVEADHPEKALRGCLLEIAFDGHPPMVVAPLGDFFGAAPGFNRFAALPCGITDEDNTLYCRWVMPFAQEARLSVKNTTDETVRISGAVKSTSQAWTENTWYFHAKYRAVRQLPTRPMIDWNYLTTTAGPGRFVGVMLNINNPVTQWWGEGDEKIYVDGESFPSHFGTGTEDYFGYAWCCPDKFSHAYHNQPRCDGPANYGETCVSRFHIMDDIPWTSGFRFDLEMWHWADVKIDQSIVAYWYAPAAVSDNTPALDPGLLTVPVTPELEGVKGAIEGEKMKVIAVDGGTTEKQIGAADWSCGAQIWWRNAQPGQQLRLAFPVEKAGRYKIFLRGTKAPDYGIMQISINGKAAGSPIDFYAKEVKASKEIALGAFDLSAGDNEIGVAVTGANKKAIPAHMFGLDYLRLEP